MVISLELQTCFASSFSQCFDTAVITKTGTIESNFSYSSLQSLFSYPLSDERCSSDVTAVFTIQLLTNIGFQC